jgi:beta-lactamase class A
MPVITKRRFAIGASAVLVGYAATRWHDEAHAAGWAETLSSEFARLERESGGRLGVAAVDTLTGAQAGHRADERFPMCSTFKLLAAAAVLARVDAGQERLDRLVKFDASDMVVNSPATKDRVGSGGMSLEELCAAAMTLSDNTAGNLLLAALGGPAA